MKKSILTYSMATLFSFLNAADVSINPKGMGDYLILPTYYANAQGWSTNIKVTNTDSTNAVVAKVVFREGVNSEEKLDFLIFLSPNDVWEARVSYENGKVKIYSTDDSTVFNGIQTGVSTPLNQNFFDLKDNEDYESGYVEIFASAKAIASSIDPNWTVGRPLDKVKIYNSYNDTILNSQTPWSDVKDDIYAVATIDAMASNLSVTLPAIAFSNFAESPMDDSIIAGEETTFAKMTDKAGTDVLTQIDNLLATNSIFVNYSGVTNVNETALYITTPTKKYWYSILSKDLSTKGYAKVYTNDLPSDWAYPYTITIKDQKENGITQQIEFSGGTPQTRGFVTELSKIAISNENSAKIFKNGVAIVNLNNLSAIPVAMSAVTVGTMNVTNAYYPATK